MVDFCKHGDEPWDFLNRREYLN